MRKAALGAGAMLALVAPGCGEDGPDPAPSRAEVAEIRRDCAREAYGGAEDLAKGVPSAAKELFDEMERGSPSAAEIRDQFGKVFAPARGLIKKERECLRREGVKPRKKAAKS